MLLSRTSLHRQAGAALRRSLRPPSGSAAPRRHLAHPFSAALAKRSAASCVASPQSYRVLSQAAARIHTRAAANASSGKPGGGGSWCTFFGRFTASLGAAAAPRRAARPTSKTNFYTSLLRQMLQQTVSPKLGLGSLRLAVEAGVAKQLAKHVSPVFRGAVQAFAGLQVRAGQQASTSSARTSFSQRINLSGQPIVSFARGSARPGSGFGPRAPLVPRSPAHGAGLQTARNFSSGGRVFDNLVVNAPLAVRLAGNELDEKRKMAKTAPPAMRGPRRSAAVITHRQREEQAVQMGRRLAAQVAFGNMSSSSAMDKRKQAEHRSDVSVAVAAAEEQVAPQVARRPLAAVSASSVGAASSCASSILDDDGGAVDYSEQMLSYFEIPPWETHTRLTIRRSEPIHSMLGGRPPQPARPGRALFDDRFLQDAQLGIEFEDRRWLKIQAILRAIYEQDPHRHLSITEDGDLYIVLVRGLRVVEAEKLLKQRLGFSLDFVKMEELAMPDGLDLSHHAVERNGAGLLAIPETAAFAPLEEDRDLVDNSASDGLPPPDSDDASSVSLTMSLPSLPYASSVLSLSELGSTRGGYSFAPDDDGHLYDSREFV